MIHPLLSTLPVLTVYSWCWWLNDSNVIILVSLSPNISVHNSLQIPPLWRATHRGRLTCAGHPATSRQQYALLLLFSLNFPFSSSPRPRSLLLLLFQSKHLLSALSKLMPLLLAYSAIVSIFHAGGHLKNWQLEHSARRRVVSAELQHTTSLVYRLEVETKVLGEEVEFIKTLC